MTTRCISKCLNSKCQHVFLVREHGIADKCPECGNAPCGSVRRGDEHRWSLKEAQALARQLRLDKNDSTDVHDTALSEAA